MSRMIATVFGVGYLRPAPGTWGSLAALPMAWALHEIGGFWLFAAATMVITVAGWWATEREIATSDIKDPSEIVVDEVAGQWIALWPVSFGAVFAGAEFLALWPGIVTAFLAFRLFDIWKPGPVGWADRQEGALGVMADDLFAGWLAAMVVAVAAVLAHLPLLAAS
ncbi:phosphatidylglycerophosphatase A family protein [Roseicyclus sp.]|uniref:phosphatidylglycerophosphatase A family protein n=1 Tax=Roseicyclus sp. TaxID=1914329 RepID=UPI003FA1510E